MRSTWLLRCVALILIGAFVPALVAPPSQAASGTAAGSYAEWLREQVRDPSNPAVEHAIEAAVATDARTFDAFVNAFAEAYESEVPAASAAHVFVDEDLNRSALITYLQRRFTEIHGEAAVPPHRVAMAGPSSITSSTSGTAVTSRHCGGLRNASDITSSPIAAGVIASLRPGSPACPQGP